MIETITRKQAITELEQSLDQAADVAHDWIVTELQLSEDDQHAAMQCVYAYLDFVRDHSLRQIARIWDAPPPSTLH
jgi:hypothetical protein